MRSVPACIICLALFFFSCRKDSFITSGGARLGISADTLKYDTVFVTAGSTYRVLKVFNENDKKLKLSSLKLMGGAGSPYKMNVDGAVGTQFSNIELEANDSLYVFVQVNVNPSAANLPFVIRDSIQIEYNGNTKKVQLEAWGQNANFFRNKVVTAAETWNNDKPYVILGSLTVAANQVLTINKGCRIYVHADAPIVINGTLQVNGLKDTADRVYFTGDRLDEPYKDYPASWPGIFFQPSAKDNVLNYAVIKNAFQAIGIQEPPPNANPKLVLNECVIDNAFDAGIIALNSSIRARNCLITNCGKNLFLVSGGNYQFTHCTVASISNRFIEHKDPVLTLTNFANGATADLTAVFRNTIFWGEGGLLTDEVVVLKSGANPFNVNFDRNLWKVQTAPANITSSGIINNQPPRFDSINTSRNYYDFRINNANPPSPAVNAGVVVAGITTDLDGKPRAVGTPDLGCFEKQ
jgi:hypothetical protein